MYFLLIFQSAFESIEISEEARVGTKILSVSLADPDITGLSLSLNCTPTFQVGFHSAAAFKIYLCFLPFLHIFKFCIPPEGFYKQ